ncbi:hypothetical protein DSL64_04865 [Dyadobacter luteus]|jgi:hypothetical protein|uniref:Uncharacterized protein n=1 Tax=Dyadobacter luteus TaxID=2259619 RepID=A0A3D8YGF5_9BACT|nr:hypothetical protein [Dyadobacter luteus]REA63762.1 hypothetical protein DSL64_04865 [Dyadobacter luteus]
MIEVFKTNIVEPHIAGIVMEVIHLHFRILKASFDLEDCDKVLRIQSESGTVPAAGIIRLLGGMGYLAEILQDEQPTAVQMMMHETKFYPVC